jgi:hypothetical protein
MRRSHAARTHAVGLASALAILLLASLFAAAIGQPQAGFQEEAGTEVLTVLDASWTVRESLAFGATETVRLNVTSNVVDWAGNAAGGGLRELRFEAYDGTRIATVLFAQDPGGPPFRYTAAVDLGNFALAPDWYYLVVRLDDTLATWEAVTPILVGDPVGGFRITTYTDDTFSLESDVFTRTSVVWVEVVGDPNGVPDRWDLHAFVDGATVVNGPRDGFDDFRRIGNVYRFSIDLDRWADNLVSGAYYVLDVRLTDNAFVQGKLLQTFDPTVTVAATDIAPATATQGETDVPLLALSLTLDPNWDLTHGPAAFNLERLRFQRTGASTNADIAGVKLYRDANGNGALDAGDALLAQAFDLGGVTFPAWLGQNGETLVALSPNVPLRLLVAFDIAPDAVAGDTVGVRLAGPADVDVHGTLAAVLGLPVSSSTVFLLAADVLTVTNDPGVAPPSAIVGETLVPVDRLTFASNGGVLIVGDLALNLTGTADPSDVAGVSLFLDDGDGAFFPALDILLAVGAYPTPGPLWFRDLDLAVDATGRSLWVVYDIALGATIGRTAGSEVSHASSVTVSPGFVFDGGFPLASDEVLLVGPVLEVDPVDLAAQRPFGEVRQGSRNVPMLRLDLSVDAGTVTVSGLRVDKTGTSTADGDVVWVKAWLDAGDGSFDIGDALLDRRAFLASTAILSGFSFAVTPATPMRVFVTFDVALAAPVGATVGAALREPTYVAVDPTSTVDGGPFPIRSTNLAVTAGGAEALLTLSSQDLAANAAPVVAGTADVPMLRLDLSVDANATRVTALRLDRLGTSTADGDVAFLRLWLDDGDGLLASGDLPVATTAFSAGVALFANLAVDVVAGSPATLFVTITLSQGAQAGRTVGVEVRTEESVAVQAPASVDAAAFPLRSSAVLVAAPPEGRIQGIVSDAAGNPLAGARVTLVELNVSVTTDADGAYAFEGLELGAYTVRAEQTGFLAAEQTVTLETGAATKIANFALEPEPSGLGLVLWIPLGLLVVLALFLLLLWLRRREREERAGPPPEAEPEEPPEPPAS